MKYFSLLTLLLSISCNTEPIKVVDLSCDQQKQVATAIVEANCNDITQYKCDVREFSPTLSSEIKKGVEYCLQESSECLRYDHQIFDTSEQKQIDEYATAADFEKGGQYNRQEVRCWNQIKNSQPAESTSVKEALKAAYEICK